MLKARVVTALCLIAALLGILFFLPSSLAAPFFAVVAALGAWEWAGLMRAVPRARLAFAALVLLSCLGLQGCAAEVFFLLWMAAAAFWFLIAPLWLADYRAPGKFAYPVGWLLLVPTWAALVALHERGPQWLLAAMALVWVADSAAYFAGRTFGRHKLAPAISPGKTWEGVAGALLGVVVYGLAIHSGLPFPGGLGIVGFVAFLLLLTAFSIVGDLFESMVKRQAGMKDSGTLLPGHGGILDRIDSLTSALPLAALGLHWMGR